MTRRFWYGYGLTLPLILPVVLIALAEMTGKFMKGNSILGWLSLFASGQLVAGGFQYVLFMFFIYAWARGKTVKQLAFASWAMPLWFWAWCTMWLLLLSTFTGYAKFYLMIGLFSLPFGYFYVALVHVLIWLLVKTGIIKD